MKKKLLSLILGLLLVLSLVACGNKTVNIDNQITEGGTTTFTVGFDAEYPPFGYMDDNGEYTGFDLELAEEVCKMEGWDLIKQPIDWDSKDMELNSGNIDCIWNGFTITGRENDYTWSVPYIDNSIVIVTSNGSDIKKLSDLEGKYVITQAGSSAYASLTETDDEELINLVSSFDTLETVPDYNTAFMNLESGIGDCIVVDISVAKYQIKNKPDKFVMLDEPFSSEQYAIGFKKGETWLKDLVERDLLELNRRGVVREIANKYQEYSIADMLCLE